MTRLIDADELIQIFEADEKALADREFQLAAIGAANTVRKMPTVDAEQVRHSKWIPKIVKICGVEHDFGMKCERCGADALNAEGDDFLTDYCPNCGARMDKE